MLLPRGVSQRFPHLRRHSSTLTQGPLPPPPEYHKGCRAPRGWHGLQWTHVRQGCRPRARSRVRRGRQHAPHAAGGRHAEHWARAQKERQPPGAAPGACWALACTCLHGPVCHKSQRPDALHEAAAMFVPQASMYGLSVGPQPAPQCHAQWVHALVQPTHAQHAPPAGACSSTHRTSDALRARTLARTHACGCPVVLIPITHLSPTFLSSTSPIWCAHTTWSAAKYSAMSAILSCGHEVRMRGSGQGEGETAAIRTGLLQDVPCCAWDAGEEGGWVGLMCCGKCMRREGRTWHDRHSMWPSACLPASHTLLMASSSTGCLPVKPGASRMGVSDSRGCTCRLNIVTRKRGEAGGGAASNMGSVPQSWVAAGEP